LSERFLIKEQSIRVLANVISERDEWKSAPDIDIYHHLFEIVLDLDYECGDWLLLVKRTDP
jgi:hypothetical protein